MRTLPLLCAMAGLCTSVAVHAATNCGELANAVGPYDYQATPPKKRDLVEHFHFTEQVEKLEKGQSTVSLGADITYTLRAFPNHPRALNSMSELGLRQKRDRPTGSPYSVECWFERAIRFRPEDGHVRLVYGIALLKRAERTAAIEQLQKADKLLPRNANVHYNLGLAYFAMRDYDKALEHAKVAYNLGFPLPGLRDMLKRENKWH